MSEANKSEMAFEEAMKELEEVIGKLEGGDVPLEDSIKLYERGAELKKICEVKLQEAEAKVNSITLDKDGNSLGNSSEGENN
jgi:exodeoxyribonuclease VII small subunit